MRRLLCTATVIFMSLGLGLANPQASFASTRHCQLNYPLVGGEETTDMCTTITGTGLTINKVSVSWSYSEGRHTKECGIVQLDKNDPDNDGVGGGTVIWDSKPICAPRDSFPGATATYNGPYKYAKAGKLTSYWLPTEKKNNFSDDEWDWFGICNNPPC
jgi:hypothetical protein